jgi:hypothetical protein
MKQNHKLAAIYDRSVAHSSDENLFPLTNKGLCSMLEVLNGHIINKVSLIQEEISTILTITPEPILYSVYDYNYENSRNISRKDLHLLTLADGVYGIVVFDGQYAETLNPEQLLQHLSFYKIKNKFRKTILFCLNKPLNRCRYCLVNKCFIEHYSKNYSPKITGLITSISIDLIYNANNLNPFYEDINLLTYFNILMTEYISNTQLRG